MEKTSATSIVKLLLPVDTGVPLIKPLEARLRPTGNDPLTRLKLRGPEPPLALTVAE